MEQGMTPSADTMSRSAPRFVNSVRDGFVLVMVLAITAVGLLFGAGALLLFRFQCQMRIDRQHELEKVYAVRSAMNYIRTYTGEISDEGKSFRYYTGSERDLGLIVKPVEAIFPDPNNPKHFNMERPGDFLCPYPKQYNASRDYEYGVANWTEKQINATSSTVGGGKAYGLSFSDLSAPTNVKWWVNIGMRDTGGWLQEDYGRRYNFWPREFVDGNPGGVRDILRFCLIRNVTNRSNSVGCRHGWPLSQIGEMALVFEIRPKAGVVNNNDNPDAEIVFSEYRYVGGSVVVHKDERLRWAKHLYGCNMGMQVADNKVSLFYIANEGLNTKGATVDAKLMSRGYTFSETVPLSTQAYDYFAKEVWIDGQRYGGVFTNDYGTVQAPELRAVFEIETASGKRPDNASGVDFLTRFKVTPAYQFDIFLEHPASVVNRATVAQKIGKYKREGTLYTVLTYDTHGTEHKGFRRDEREAARRRGK